MNPKPYTLNSGFQFLFHVWNVTPILYLPKGALMEYNPIFCLLEGAYRFTCPGVQGGLMARGTSRNYLLAVCEHQHAKAFPKSPRTQIIGSLQRGYRGYIGIYGGYIGVFRTQIGPKYHYCYSIWALTPCFLGPWTFRD